MMETSEGWADLPLAQEPVLPEEIEQELADLAKGVLQPKLNFASLRKKTLDLALAELGFQRLGSGYCRELDGFMVAIDITRHNANRALCFDLGFHPMPMWDAASHSDWPVLTAPFRGTIAGPGGASWWKHGLEEVRACEVLQAAADFLRKALLPELREIVAFCETASPSQLSDAPVWLSGAFSGEATFARYRHVAGRSAEAAEFARAALARLPAPGPLAHLQAPSPIETEMRRLADG